MEQRERDTHTCDVNTERGREREREIERYKPFKDKCKRDYYNSGNYMTIH